MSVSDTDVSDVTWTDNGTFNLSEGHTPQTDNSDGTFGRGTDGAGCSAQSAHKVSHDSVASSIELINRSSALTSHLDPTSGLFLLSGSTFNTVIT